jgi:glutamate---cysteine ligase / carboxylate-amine ligase
MSTRTALAPTPLATTARTFGIEEEFMLVDPVTLEQQPRAEAVLDRLATVLPPGTSAAHEFLASQVEHASPVFSGLPQALAELSAFRAHLAAAAHAEGLVVYSGGMPFQTAAHPTLTDDPRYDRVRSSFREVIADHQVSGLHVHVAVPDREVGVRVLGRIRPWLPTLLALSGNSPFWRGVDTGFASWRSIMMRRWVTGGCPPVFRDAADYDRRLAALVGVGGTVDVETVAWNARLSEHYPTVELRVFDAQLDPADSVLLASLARGIVERAVEDDGEPMPAVDPELLDAALWHAARDGLSDELVCDGALVPAQVAVAALVDHIRVDDADLAFIRAQLDRLAFDGIGAQRQRDAYAEAGVEGLGMLAS